ncbi:alcohol dehydrogenase [bacterium]|nr:MAG: alcohol dehydrogenase [bacterium]
MIAVRLHGARDLRVDHIADPPEPGRGEVLVRVTAAGICGSDLHTYQDGRIGDTLVTQPLVLGHEFAAEVLSAGPEALDGTARALPPGTRVAVDPAQACGRCEQCEQGNPNLCLHLKFCGLFPNDGCYRERMIVTARQCFPLPDGIDNAGGALLEPLGVALHATDLSHIRPGDSVAILGAGPIGLLILQTVRLAGAEKVFISDRLPWRLDIARRLGGTTVDSRSADPVAIIMDQTNGRGVDVAIEAAWAEETVQQAVEMARYGGRVTLVGIPADDRLTMSHSPARRKGLTLRFCRRMKHTYPRATQLVEAGRVDVRCLISHRFPLAKAFEAFELNSAYGGHIVKAILVPFQNNPPTFLVD